MHTEHPFHRTFATTIAFVIAAPLLTAALILSSYLPGEQFGVVQRPVDGFETCLTVAAYAGFAGVLVDLMRLVTRRVWRKKLPFRLKLKRVLKDNLSASDHGVGELRRG
jgi:hypothetical protein